MPVPCKWDVQMGKVMEFMDSIKGLKGTIFAIALTILLQVGSFLVLWGGLAQAVKNNTEDIAAICKKLDTIKFVGYVYAEPEKTDARSALPSVR